MGDFLTYDTYHGGDHRHREPESLIDAWRIAYVTIQRLPAELRNDLTEDPLYSVDFKTTFDHGDHLGGLANRLRDHLRATEPRTAVIRRALQRVSG